MVREDGRLAGIALDGDGEVALVRGHAPNITGALNGAPGVREL